MTDRETYAIGNGCRFAVVVVINGEEAVLIYAADFDTANRYCRTLMGREDLTGVKIISIERRETLYEYTTKLNVSVDEGNWIEHGF